MSNAIAVTAATFDEEVLKSAVPVIVDFWATWCGPCRMIAPHLDKIAADYSGRAKVVKVDVDQEPDLALQYGVQSIPTLLYIANGEVKDQTVGALSYKDIAAKLEAIL